MGARNYTEATKKALFALSLGRCYEPDCQTRVITMAPDGTPVVTVHIAHIRAASYDGPRFDESMDDDERRAFRNLLLLCAYHHPLVDNKTHGDSYSLDILIDWKKKRNVSVH